MTAYIPRTTRQHIEREVWIEDAVDFLLELGVFTANEEPQAREVAKKLLYFNKDEGGELMEVNAREYVRCYVREVLEG